MAQLSDDTLANVFKALDKDGSQKLDKSEIRVLVENVVKLYEDQLGSEEKKNQEVEVIEKLFICNLFES